MNALYSNYKTLRFLKMNVNRREKLRMTGPVINIRNTTIFQPVPLTPYCLACHMTRSAKILILI